MKNLGKLFIIVPDEEIELFQSCIKDKNYQIIPEKTVVPEFKLFKNYDSWDPANSFLEERTFYFSVMQSNTRINPDEIWQKVSPYLQQG